MTKGENFLNFKIFKNKNLIEKALGYSVEMLEMEMSVNCINTARKIDIVAEKEDNGKLIFIEIQLKESDETHLNQFKELLDEENDLIIDNCEFVWVANNINQEHMNELFQVIKDKNKNITLHAIVLSEFLINTLVNTEIEGPNFLKSINENYNFTDDDFSKVYEFRNSSIDTRKDSSNELLFRDLIDDSYINASLIKKILDDMRKKSGYLSLHLYKDLSKNLINIGLGKDSFSCRIGISHAPKMLYIAVKFYSYRKKEFNKLKLIEDELQDEFNHLLEFDFENKDVKFEFPVSTFTDAKLIDFISYNAVKLIERFYCLVNNEL